MAKKYFRDEEDEFCYTKASIIEQMKNEGITKLTVIEAQRTDVDYFFCKEFDTVGERGEGCGKECEAYIPRNGKSGICKHWRHCYEPTDNELTITL